MFGFKFYINHFGSLEENVFEKGELVLEDGYNDLGKRIYDFKGFLGKADISTNM